MIVVWSTERGRFEAVSSYMERDIPRAERWRWDPAAKRWWAPNENIARRLARYAQGEAAARLVDISDEERRSLAASTAADAEIEIPVPPGLAYLPYQRAGIAYALTRRNTLIADEMGLGKTIQAIGTVNALAARHPLARVLIVCPASLRLNWRAEWLRWHAGPLRPTLLDTWPGGQLFDGTTGRALIVSYDSVRKWHPRIAQRIWDVLILDEAHMLKEAGTRRAATIFGGKRGKETFLPLNATCKLFLSGTPIVNRPKELWPLVHALAPDTLGASKTEFVTRYDPAWGAERLGELQVKLRSQIMVRRLKADVLKDLPRKRRQVVLLDVQHAERIVAAEQDVLRRQREAAQALQAEIARLPHAQQVARLQQCRAMALSEIARIRHDTALAKLPAATEHIHELLENCEKLVVFAHHHDVVDGLADSFRRICVQLDGRTDEMARKEAVDRFRDDRRSRVFIGSIRAAGLGITLTAASVVAFVELDWTPAGMMQAEDRLHRIGQVNPVLVHHLVVDGSIDAKMSRLLVEKQAMIDATLDGHGHNGHAPKDILSEVLA